MQGPHGNCFYVPGKADQPLLLVGTGTGLAPLYAIVRDALHHGHTGPIHLYQGSLRAEGLYCVDTLRELAATHENFHYTPCVLEGDAPEGVTVGSIDALVQQDLPKLSGFRAYLCGAPDLVKLMQRKVFLAGVSMQEIFSDPFVPAATKN
jgi:NAD(P)H-flavin reductase